MKMFKKIATTAALVAISAVLVLGAVNRTLAKDSSESYGSSQGGSGHRNGQVLPSSAETSSESYAGQGNGANGQFGQGARGNGDGELAFLPPATTGELSDEEAAALLYMREEEKLAHDVYVTFYAQWGLPTFQTISQSEQAHTEAVKTLLDRYGLSDPASGTAGVFTNPDLQALYDELVTRGSVSLAEAIKVGAAIEEIDILDLQERLSQTDNADIQQVFNNLLKGSGNHLRSFSSTLSTQTGETYQPQYLSADAYQAILGTAPGRGGSSNGRGHGQGGNGGGGNRYNTQP